LLLEGRSTTRLVLFLILHAWSLRNNSDTVAPTLVFLFYQLALNPTHADKLYDELKDVDIRKREVLETLPHLNALINETLRLHPAVPSGGYRDLPPEGMTLGGRYIPGNTTIVAPRYTINRCNLNNTLVATRPKEC
jgi:cytochrome P450